MSVCLYRGNPLWIVSLLLEVFKKGGGKGLQEELVKDVFY